MYTTKGRIAGHIGVTMAQQISQAAIDQVSTESFAQNVANFRSYLMKAIAEITSADSDEKRVSFLLGEVAGMQEIVSGQIQRAVTNARDLGVPPESLKELERLYQKVLQALANNLAKQHSTLFAPQVDAMLVQSDKAKDLLSIEQKQFVAKIRAARQTLTVIVDSPQAADLVLPSFISLISEIGVLWAKLLAEGHSTLDVSGNQPPKPPAAAQPRDGGDDLPRRVTKLEENMHSIQIILARMEEKMATKSDLVGVNDRLGRVESTMATKSDISSINEKLGRVEERLTHIPTRSEVYLGAGLIAAALLGLIAKAAKWI